MRASVELIEALRRAATRIEDPNGGFDWMASEHCNCGILAQELGVEAHRLENIGLWTHLVENHCTVTGIPLNDVLQELHDAGILPSDIEGIEACNRPNVLARIGLDAPAKPYGIIDTYHRRNDQSKLKAIVASYFRAQAEILEEELTNLRQCGVESRHAGGSGNYDRSCPGVVSSVNKDQALDSRGEICERLDPIDAGELTPLTLDRAGNADPASPSSAGPLPQSPSQPVACVHMWCGGQCLYCCALEPVTAPVREASV